MVDKTRNYKPNTDTSHYLHYRPIDIDIWYPADSSAGTQASVRSLLGLLETRANYYSASNIGNGITTQLAQFFCEAFKCSDTTRLLNFKTNSFEKAKAANGKFPLVIYMTAFNGMSYENYKLFEALAAKGFIVASISSIGRFPGDMKTKEADLMEQVNDAFVAVNALKKNPSVDATKIGIVGYSWGGLAGAILASKISPVGCLVSLEGSEFHHYGNSKEEDADFNTIIAHKTFKDMQLSAPYLRLESAPASQPDKYDSIYNFSENHINSAQIFTIDSARREDFDCFSLVVKQSGDCLPDSRYTSALKLTVGFLDDHLRGGDNFSKTVEEESNKTIKKK